MADQGDAGAGMVPFRFASKEEGTVMMLANKKYYEELSPNKLAYTMQSADATMEEYFAFAKEQVLDWTDKEMDILTRGMKDFEESFKSAGWKMPPLDTIVFIRTTMLEENSTLAYTHGTQIYLGDFIRQYTPEAYENGQLPDEFRTLIAHEVFHCLTRCNPDFRARMYGLIHFTVEEREYPIPPSVWEYYISNPDVEHHNSWATFVIDGKEINCFTAFITTKHFEKKGDRFFGYGMTALVPIDGSDVFYPKDQASNFYEVFGKNTEYVIDPEECMADNFSFAVVFGMNGPSGKGYPNPEIIEGIMKILNE